MGAILSWLLSNPLSILAMIGIFTFTSIGSDIKHWFAERHAVQQAVKPWVKAVAERDQAAAQKEEILDEALNAKVKAELAISEIQARFENEDYKRKLAGTPECYWSDDDLRLLNSAIAERPASRH